MHRSWYGVGMTITTDTPTLLDVMKRAAALVKEHDLREVDDDGNDTDRAFQVNHRSWRDVFTWYDVEIPAQVLVRYVDGDPRFLGDDGQAVARKRVSVQNVARPTEHEDGTMSITCSGPCGQTQPVNKYPTLKNGGRGTVCRACEKAGRDARKGS